MPGNVSLDFATRYFLRIYERSNSLVTLARDFQRSAKMATRVISTVPLAASKRPLSIVFENFDCDP
ncbi:hypothetical protein HOV93_33710 [Planctomycetes bacterium FF15]|uniref:Uncharacterized protein n=1 Tax=Bremerella alba TaxID=980252 RepID=A0A7V9A891_9BACT|nr:hypothetical protein [Bremerella alba]